MSVLIETVEDLKQLLKLTKVKVENPQELAELLTRLKAIYNPDIARVRTIKIICSTAISVSVGVAGMCTFFVLPGLGHGENARPNVFWAMFCVIAVMWIVAGVVSALALVLGLLWLRKHPAPAKAEAAVNPVNAVAGNPPSTAFTDLNLSKFNREPS